MSRLSDERTIELLRGVLTAPAVDAPSGDLWPRVRGGIDRSGPHPPVRDWMLAAALALLCLLRPSLLRILLLHF